MGMATGIMGMDMAKVIMAINNSDMRIKTYIINLKDSTDRREAVLAETAGYPFMDVELVEAVDGRKMEPEEINACFDSKKFLNRYYRILKGGEVGCTLSHRVCYRKLLESDEEFALILEDDVNFIYPEDVEATLKDIVDNYSNSKPYFITLAMHCLYYPKKCRKLGKYTFYRIDEAYGTCAYLINRKAAERLLSVPLPFTVADDFPFIRQKGISVVGIYPTFAVGASTKEIIPTEIQEEPAVYSELKITHYIRIYYRLCCRRILLKLGKLSERRYHLGINE
ncbi:glycosyltransferase family 25 protein [Parabacteroides sp.]